MPPKGKVDLGPPAPPPARLAHTLSSHAGAVHVVKYNTGARYCLSGGQDKMIKLWNTSTGNEVKEYKGHGYEVLGLCVAPDNARFASCGGDRSVYLWDVTGGAVISRFRAHSGKVNTVDFNDDASVLASGSYDSTVCLWDLKSQNRSPIQTLTEARDSITSVVFSGPTVISGSVDGWVREYDIRMGELRADCIGHPVTSLTLSPISPTLLVSTLDSHVRLFDRKSGKMLGDFTGHKNDSYKSQAAMMYGEGGVVCGDEDGKLWSWGVLDAKPLETSQVKRHDRFITWVETNPTTKDEMLTASADGTVKIWKR